MKIDRIVNIYFSPTGATAGVGRMFCARLGEKLCVPVEDVDITRRLHAKHKTLFYPSVSIYHRFSRLSYHKWHLSLAHMFSVVKYFNKWGWIYDSGRRRYNKRLLRELKNSSKE